MAQLSPPVAAEREPPHAPEGRWWVPSVSVAGALGAFAAYALWTVLAAGRSEFGPFLSPFYSPRLGGIGALPAALLILPVPLAFRASCYHYRKAYNRALFGHPVACARVEPGRRQYHGETRFPISLNNLHRFALYLSVVVLAFLWIDAVDAFSYHGHLYAGVGSLLMLVNVALLTGYTLGCHSLRHLVGGGVDCFSAVRCGAARRSAWRGVSALTARHGLWAWSSLASVAGVDLYIRLLQHGLGDLHLGG